MENQNLINVLFENFKDKMLESKNEHMIMVNKLMELENTICKILSEQNNKMMILEDKINTMMLFMTRK